MRCVVALVTGSGQEEVEVPAAGRWWRCSGLSGRLRKISGAVALSKVPPQATGLVHPFASVFVLLKDLARHGTEPVGFVLRFGKGGASDVAKLSSGQPRVGLGRQGAQCPARGQCQFLQGARG